MYVLTCLLLLLYNYVEANFTSKWQRMVLFPAAQRIRRSSAELQDPVLQTSELEVELLYEFLLTGVHLDKENRLSLLDPELASLRKAATFDVVCNDVIPKSISDIKRLAAMLSHQRGPLRKADFERTLLTAAYAAYRTSTFRNVHQQKVWLETLGNLFTTLKRDLTF
ncbi:protein FAM180A [Spea bombifrons]|uniref:protein FAM180A n=1 Tax=Spea bombifrons TaxID=233779 RepID=UPI00234BAEE1|nr:protein FAM180A [Spea bombifrons]